MALQNTSDFQTRLQQQRDGLLAQLATLRGGAVSRADASAEHFAARQDSTASITTERELELALDAREVAELEAVDAALKRIATGTYGECVECGADIAVNRLNAAPEAPRCLACQQRAELA